MKRNVNLTSIMLALMLALGASFVMAAPRAQEKEGKESQAALAREAKITMDQARETALQRAPGKVEDGELEREHGKLVYSFDIRNSKGTITEVQVSAITGKVVRVEHENKKQEANEKRQEKHEKTRKP